jgi:hypothetical protein
MQAFYEIGVELPRDKVGAFLADAAETSAKLLGASKKRASHPHLHR